MKKLSILLAVFAAVVIFNSCNEEYALPTVTWEGGVSRIVDFTTDANYDLNLDITFAAEAGISDIVITKYIYSGLDDITTVTLTEPTGYAELTTFDYTFTADNSVEDFTGGVTKIVYEFEVTDAELQVKTAEYTIFVIEAYAVTFDVRDEANAVITDAVVTFNGVTNAAGDYVFEYIEEGTYDYSITKTGYDNVTFTGFVMPANDTTVTVEMIQSIPTAWTGPVILALEGQHTWATYNGTAVTIFESTTIGVGFTYTDAGIGRITTTTNCDGWVVVADPSTITTIAQLATTYAAGTPVTQIDLLVDQRAYVEKYFIAKIGSTYRLVHYDFGYRSAATGNILGFEYKN